MTHCIPPDNNTILWCVDHFMLESSIALVGIVFGIIVFTHFFYRDTKEDKQNVR